MSDGVALGSIALSAVVYALTPAAARRGAPLFKIGIAYQIILGLGIGIINQWEPLTVAGRISWLCVLILIFPSIVPSPPRLTLIGSLAVATMDPFGLLVAHLRGIQLPPLTLLAWTYLPNYACAVLAVLPATIIIRLRREVDRARRLGSYRLVERIGMGGMGEVWKAEHRLLARPAAIKLIRGRSREETIDPVTEERFRREADAAASLRSPHTIQLYDFGISRDGRLYYVMELLEGIDLESLVGRFGPQPPQRVVHILRQACRSLAEAHAAGLVHRDIKPANLHLGRMGLEYDFVKVLDFGLVKSELRWERDELKITTPELTAGTPAYMAPELISGGAVDGRADIYALGCVGYYLLTGSMVFKGETPVQLIVQHLQSEPEPPSVRLGAALPAGLEALILRCLAKTADGRPASAQELEKALDATAAGDWGQDLARKWWDASHLMPAGADPVRLSPVTAGALETTAVSDRFQLSQEAQ
jgi:serine/threonine-protein kinase